MKPFAFKRNRVGRIYLGGALIDKLQGAKEARDSFKPEEWLASTVKACNDGGTDPMEGVSVALLDGEEIPFTELSAREPEALFGAEHVAKHGAIPGFLAKFLDSAIRLPLQAHPDVSTAKRLYNSKFGKTEAWIVLGGRDDGAEKPHVLLGFNEKLDKELFRKESLSGEMPRSVEMLHKHQVKPGDVLMIRGGVPHAIGPGNFILEIMEPSDWVVQPELYCGTRKLSVADRFGSVDPETSLEVFHYESASKEETWRKAASVPRTLAKSGSFELISLIDREKTGYFGALKLRLNGEWTWDSKLAPFALCALLEGSCEIKAEGSSLRLKQGDCAFIPNAAKGVRFEGTAVAALCLGPA